MGIVPLDLKTQYKNYQAEIDAGIKSVIDTTSFIQGQVVREFEAELAKYLGVKDVVACSSGTDALFLALSALEVTRGDEVITTPFTFIATAEAISYLGAVPVFVDVDQETFNLDPKLILEKITKKTKVILPVSLFGVPADMSLINEIAKENDVIVLEDAAQSIGSTHHGDKSGNLSSVGATSFFPSKPLGAYGDGGAVMVKDNEVLADKVRCLLNHGQVKKYHHAFIGINGRLDSIQASVLKVKLKHLDNELGRRNEIAKTYLSRLKPHLYSPQKIPDHVYSAYAQFSLLTRGDERSREKVLSRLTQHEIPWAIYYPIPIHLQEAFRFLGYKQGDFPNCEKLAETIFSIPIHPFLKDEEVEKVILVLNSV